MSLLLVGSGNSPLQPIADFLRDTFRQDVSISYAPQLALRHLQSPQQSPPDVMVADISGQSIPGAVSFLYAVQFAFPDLPVVAMTTLEQAESSDELMRAGSMDVLAKPVSRPRLRIAVLNALRMRSLREEVRRMRMRERSGQGFTHVIAKSPRMELAVNRAKKAAEQSSAIWLQGEYGTGKEMLARAILSESAQAKGPFIAVSCNAQSENILERQLFGGASRRMIGAVQHAEGGMLYLDEIEQCSPRILQMLAEWMRAHASYSDEVSAANARPRLVISTRGKTTDLMTHRDLHHLLSDRWKLSPIELPALRERIEDIPALAANYLKRFCSMEGRTEPALTPDAVQWLQSRNWPGNLPEFSRCLHIGLSLSEGQMIEVEHLEGRRIQLATNQTIPWLAPAGRAMRSGSEGYLPVLTDDGKLRPLAALEDDMLQFALKHYSGCMARAARALGIGRSTLYRKLQERTPGTEEAPEQENAAMQQMAPMESGVGLRKSMA